MESWPHIIWIKRFAPVIVIVLAWFGYTQFTERAEVQSQQEYDTNALVMAKLWVASARYRSEIDQYNIYRDSLFETEGITKADLDHFLTSFDGSSAGSIRFAELVDKYVDSLVSIEESLLGAVPDPEE